MALSPAGCPGPPRVGDQKWWDVPGDPPRTAYTRGWGPGKPPPSSTAWLARSRCLRSRGGTCGLPSRWAERSCHPRALATWRRAAPTSSSQINSPHKHSPSCRDNLGHSPPTCGRSSDSAGPGRPPSFPEGNSPLPQKATRKKRTRECAPLMAVGAGERRGELVWDHQTPVAASGRERRSRLGGCVRRALGPRQEPAPAAVTPPTGALGGASSSGPAPGGPEDRNPVMALGSPDLLGPPYLARREATGQNLRPLYNWGD